MSAGVGATMKAAVLTRPERFEVREAPVPEVGARDVLVRVARVGICGTDMHIFHGKYARECLPLIPGHEFSGVIAEVGSEVAGLREGMAVVVDMNIGCGKCFWCRRNEILNCAEMRQVGIHIDGALAEYVCVPARLVIPAPTHLSFEVLALCEPLACIVRSARKSGATFGQSAAVLGAGPAGNLHVQLLRAIGVAPIVVCEPSAERAEMARAGGADVVVTDPKKMREAVLSHTQGRGADIVIESVGNRELYKQALGLMRKGGHLAAFGLPPAGEAMEMDIFQTILEENSVKGSVAGMGEDMHDSLALLAHGRIKTDLFLGATYELDGIQEAYETFAERTADLKTQIIISQEGEGHGKDTHHS